MSSGIYGLGFKEVTELKSKRLFVDWYDRGMRKAVAKLVAVEHKPKRIVITMVVEGKQIRRELLWSPPYWLHEKTRLVHGVWLT